MSRLSDWYQSAVKRIEIADTAHAVGNRQRAHERHIKRQRKQGYKAIDQQMRDLRRPARPDDTPPWEKH